MYNFLYSYHLSAWYCIDIIRKILKRSYSHIGVERLKLMSLRCLAMFWLHLGMFKMALVLWALLQIPLILVILHLFIVLYRCIPTLATDLLANSSFITNLAGNNITKSVIEAGLQWVHSLYQWLFPFWYYQHFLNSLFQVICFHKYHLSRLHFLCTRKYRSDKTFQIIVIVCSFTLNYHFPCFFYFQRPSISFKCTKFWNVGMYMFVNIEDKN